MWKDTRMEKPVSDTSSELMKHAANDRLDRRAGDLIDPRHATVEHAVSGAWWDPAHHLLQFPTGSDVLAEGVCVQDVGDDARMVVSGCGGKRLKEQ